MALRVSASTARYVAAICVTVPFVAFAYRLSLSKDVHDPYQAYKSLDSGTSGSMKSK